MSDYYYDSLKFGPDDVAKSISLRDGDFRMVAYLDHVPREFFAPSAGYDTDPRWAHSFIRNHNGSAVPEEGSARGRYWNFNYPDSRTPKIRADIIDLRSPASGGRSEFANAIWEGDFDTGIGNQPDGAYLEKSDEGWYNSSANPGYISMAYWSREEAFFSPTKQAPSAGVFGSLPTGVKRTLAAYEGGKFNEGRPWRTLLFCPNPLSGTDHFGFTAPADSLLLDFFKLPVVEPYAISEPLSTAGKINMNTQILPFTDIVRESGLYALFSSERVTALRNGHDQYYKTTETPPVEWRRYRYLINIGETLKQFHARFAPGNDPTDGDIFRSASEICSIFLVPDTQQAGKPTIGTNGAAWDGTSLSVPGMTAWWEGYRLTGNNLRERPYSRIYPLLTTKSNTYTVHMIAQTLAPGTSKVIGEYRGSTMLERYIDPADDRIGTGTGKLDPDKESLEPLYRFRIVETKRFAP